MGRPPWAICVATCADAVVGLAVAVGGIGFVGYAVWALFNPHRWLAGIILMGGLWGLAAFAVGCFLAWVAVELWKGAAWARWPSALLAVALVPGAVLLTVWAGQGGLLILGLAGPIITVGLFLPAARRYVGKEAAESPAT